jgi:3-hydroxyanthranilate 3,4-dioxygenase
VREFPERRKTLNVLRDATKTWGSFDDFPVAPAGVDPSPHLSRSMVPQPFYLVSSLDEVLITMSGQGEVRLRDDDRTVFSVGPGDVVYVPACVPCRILPATELVQVRLKSPPPLQEAAAWYCEQCDVLVHAEEFVTDVPQRAYWDALSAYNADTAARTCGACGHENPVVDTAGIEWEAVSAVLAASGS